MKLILPEHLEKHEMNINVLLMKATTHLENKNYSVFRWIAEYQDAAIKYVEFVMKAIALGLSLKLNVDPELVQKSIKVPLITLMKAAKGEEIEGELFYKSLFTRLKEKFTIAKNFFSRFKFNRGKPLEPIQFKGRVIYNPETDAPLSEGEWNQITKDVTLFLGDKIGGMEEEMIVRAGLFGKLLQKFEEDGKTLNEIKNMSYDEVEEEHGEIPTTLDEAVEDFNLSSPERAGIEWAKTHAAEHLSIEDGSLKQKIVNMVRKQIVGGLEDGISPQEMVSRLYWIDAEDILGQRFKQDTIDAINRDFRRIVLTEVNSAMNNGYLLAVGEKNRKLKRKSYFVFAGGINKGTCKECKKWLGTTVLLVNKPLTGDVINDPNAKYAIWPGKNNVGKKPWWICLPLHPNEGHYWEEIDPEEEVWDKEINKIIFKIEEVA